MRLFRILEYALASLLRRPGKTFAILVVYTVLIIVLASVLFLTQALKMEAVAMLDDGPELIVQKTLAGRHDLIPVAAAERLAALPGVRSATPRVWGYYYDALIEANYTLQAFEPFADEVTLLQGRMPSGEEECALGAGVARARRVQTGDDLILIDHENIGRIFTVTGIFDTSSDVLTQDLVVMPVAPLRRFFGLPDQLATDIAVRIGNPNEIETIATKIKRMIPDSRPITRRELLRTYAAVFDWRGGMMLALFSSALLAFCILAWDKATGLSAGEKREIGILKAIGWDTGDVLLLKFWEGLAISLLAFLSGCVIAFLLVFRLGAPLLGDILRGWSVLFPTLQPAPFLDFYQVATLAFLTVVPYVASTVIPAWRAAIAAPDDVLRS